MLEISEKNAATTMPRKRQPTHAEKMLYSNLIIQSWTKHRHRCGIRPSVSPASDLTLPSDMISALGRGLPMWMTWSLNLELAVVIEGEGEAEED